MPTPPSAMLKVEPPARASVAPAEPLPAVPTEIDPLPGCGANVAPAATVIAVFPRVPPGARTSVPLPTVVLPL